jgi:IS30 family transposase
MVRLLHLLQRDGEALHDALKARRADLPAALLRPITWDQGAEMACHLTITQSLGAPVYFYDSRSPWQRGSNENINGLLRDYFTKGTDLSTTRRSTSWPSRTSSTIGQGAPSTTMRRPSYSRGCQPLDRLRCDLD